MKAGATNLYQHIPKRYSIKNVTFFSPLVNLKLTQC